MAAGGRDGDPQEHPVRRQPDPPKLRPPDAVHDRDRQEEGMSTLESHLRTLLQAASSARRGDPKRQLPGDVPVSRAPEHATAPVARSPSSLIPPASCFSSRETENQPSDRFRQPRLGGTRSPYLVKPKPATRSISPANAPGSRGCSAMPGWPRQSTSSRTQIPLPAAAGPHPARPPPAPRARPPSAHAARVRRGPVLPR